MVLRSLYQLVGSALALDHALVMLLLLVGLLSIRERQRRYVPWVLLLGVALSLFTPVHTLEFTWPIVSAVVLPPLLWQMAVQMAAAQPALDPRAWLTWLATGLLIGLALAIGGGVSLASAVLLGILATSLIWQIRERVTGSTDLGAFGQLTLALLLAEVDLSLHPLGPLLGSLFAGAVLGLLLGYVGVRIAFRLPRGQARNWFCLGLAYVAYLLGALIGGSGVVSAAMTGLMVAVYGYSAGLWVTQAELPVPLNQPAIFVLMAGAFLLLGWQAHAVLTVFHLLGIVLSMAAAAVGVWLGRRLLVTSGPEAPRQPEVHQSAPGPGQIDERREGLYFTGALWRKERKVVLLLMGTLLLWPQQAVLEPLSLAVALLAALVTLAILRVMLYPAFDLLGAEIRRPEN
jgi:NhaP-type Na+/H+ or K+/H+ antiporter